MPNKRLPIPGQDKGNWGTILNEHLNQTTNPNYGGINYWDTAGRPTGLTNDDRGRTGVNTNTSFIEQWDGNGWIDISRPRIFVDNVDGLRNLPTQSENMVIKLKGYYIPGDCDIDEYIWSPNSTLPDNGGCVIAPSSNPAQGRWVRHYNGDVNVNHWGVFADGDVSMNTQGLLALRDFHNINYADTHLNLFFPSNPLPYQYDDNRFVRNVKKVTINGYGSSLQNVYASNNLFDGRSPIYLFDQFVNNADRREVDSAGNRSSSYPIQSAGSGDISIKLQNPADISNFLPGDWIFISCYDQQGSGQPPNMRYFEYKKVESVDSGAGEIFFSESLTDNYDSTYPDIPQNYGTYGAARVTNCRNSNVRMHDLIEIKGVNFLENPNATSHSAFKTQGIYVRLLDCIFPFEMHVQNAKYVEMENCVIHGECELDKNVERSRMYRVSVYNELDREGSRFGIRGGVGVKKSEIIECESHGMITAASDSVRLISNRVIATKTMESLVNSYGLITMQGPTPDRPSNGVSHFIAENNTLFVDRSQNINFSNGLIYNSGSIIRLTPALVDSIKMEFPYNGNPTVSGDSNTFEWFVYIKNGLKPGKRIYTSGGLLGIVNRLEINPNGNLQSVYLDSRTSLYIPGTPIYYHNVENYFGKGNIVQNFNGYGAREDRSPFLNKLHDNPKIELSEFPWRVGQSTIPCFKRIREIEVNISRVYRLTQNNPRLIISKEDENGVLEICRIDLEVLGYRNINPTNSITISPDDQVGIAIGDFCLNLLIEVKDDSGNLLTGIESDRPLGTIKFNTFE